MIKKKRLKKKYNSRKKNNQKETLKQFNRKKPMFKGTSKKAFQIEIKV